METFEYSKLLDEFNQLSVDNHYREIMKLLLIAHNHTEIKKYGLICNELGELIISDALSQMLDPTIFDLDDFSLIIGKLSKQSLWIQTKPVRHMTLFIHQFIDRQHKKNKHLSTCKKGCSACCHQTINIFPDEGDLIKESGFHIPKTFNNTCPFLKENICSIYEIRPVACRNHLSVSDPALCQTAPEQVQNIGDLSIAILISAFLSAYNLIPLVEV